MTSSAEGFHRMDHIDFENFSNHSVEHFEDSGGPDSANRMRRRVASREKLRKRVQFADQHQGSSEDGWDRSERFHSNSPNSDLTQPYWDHGDYEEDHEVYPTLSPQVRDLREMGTTTSRTSLHHSVSADRMSLRFHMEITPEEVRNFEIPELLRSGTVPNARNDEGFVRELEKRHILNSSSSLDDQGQEFIEMWHTDDPPEEPFTHWRHIQRQFMDLEEFTDLALQTPHVIDSDMMSVLVKKFMAKVKKKFSISPRQGERTLHGVLRCDAQGIQDGVPVNVTATWLCFPYLSKGDNYKDGISAKASRGLYRTRTLFQWSYENEPASERDERQAFKKETKELLYVPQVWILILGKDTIITSSPCSLEQLLPERVRLQQVTTESHTLRWVKLIDPFHREHIVPATACETFYALSISVREMCFEGEEWDQMYDLFIDDRRLTADLWLSFTASHNSSTLAVWIREPQEESHSDATSTSAESSDFSEDSGAEAETSVSESLTDSTSIHTPSYGTSSETTLEAKSDTENTQPIQIHVKKGRRGDVVVCAPGNRLAIDGVIQKAISQVRPFLEWDLKRNDSVIDLSNQALREKATTLYLLTNIHGKLYSPGHRFPHIDSVSPELNGEYLGKSLYEEATMATFEEIEGLENDEKKGRRNSTHQRPRRSSTSTADPQLDFSRSTTRQKLKKERHEDQRSPMILQIIQSTKQLIALFVSCSEDHILLEKIWGALKTLAVTTADPSPEHRLRLKQMENWTVLGSPDSIERMRAVYKIPVPDRHPWDVCEPCKHGITYQSTEDAVRHLVREHYYKTVLTEKKTNALSLLVQSVEETWMTEIRQAHYALLEVVLKHLDNFRRRTYDLKIGLAQNITDCLPAYTLPSTMIQVLENVVVFMLVCSHTADLIDSAYETWVPTKFDATAILKVNDYIDFVDRFGKSTEDILIQACGDIHAMIRDKMLSSLKVCKNVGMQYTTSNLLKHLLVRPLVNDHSTVEFYANIYSGLEYRVFHDRPHRRLFGKIHLLQEDISALLKVRRAQHSVFNDLRNAINPKTFRFIEPTEVVQCNSSTAIINSTIEAAEWDITELHWILRHSLDLERRAKHRIEILEEDHGKAIFVFTLVTAVFLPLSFVTSYMGMNTADIRDMRETQGRFWMVAVPVTVMVMVTAAFLAYKGHVVKVWLFSMPKWLDKGETGVAEASQGRRRVEPVPGEKSAAIGLFRGARPWRRGGGKNLDQANQLPV